MPLMVDRGLGLVASRLGRLDMSGLQQGTAGAKGRFKASVYEPDGAGAGSAWTVLLGVEPTSRTGKDTLFVVVNLLLNREALQSAVQASYRLMSPDNDYGLLRLLQAPRLNEKAYAGVTWAGDDWTVDAYAPPPGGDRALVDRINDANGGYCFAVDVQAIEAVTPEEKEYTRYLAVRAMLDIRPLYGVGL